MIIEKSDDSITKGRMEKKPMKIGQKIKMPIV